MTGRGRRVLGALACLALAAVTAPALVLSPARADGCASGKGSYPGTTPWAQQSLDAGELAAHSTGAGQTVAVLASGVDAANGQFEPGQVLPGHDVLAGKGPADNDCDGRGTVAAGLIAAQHAGTTTFAGLAPDVRIDPIRYVQSTSNADNSAAADPAKLAAAVDAAVADRVNVILVVVPAVQDSAQLQASVASAVRAGIVVVAPTSAAKGGRTYPAGYPGVLGVGAVNQSGAVVTPEVGAQVSLVAPGNDLVSTAPGGGVQNLWPINLPGFAGAFVAAAAALVRAEYPSMTAAQVVGRLELTAARAQPAVRTDSTGWGSLDVYAALTADLPLDAAPPTGPAQAPPARMRALPAPPPDGRRTGPAPWIALGLVGLGFCLGLATLAHRRARAARV